MALKSGTYPAITGGYVVEVNVFGRRYEFKSENNGVRGIGIADVLTIDDAGVARSKVLGVVVPVPAERESFREFVESQNA